MQIQSVKNNYSSLFKSTNDKKITYQRMFQNIPILWGYPQNDTVEISFGGKYCSTENFKVKRIENLKCPVCGKIMLSDKQINSFVKDVAPKKGEQLVQALEKYEDDYVFTNKRLSGKTSIYRPVSQDAVDIIKHLAKEYPNEDLFGLFQIQKQKSMQELIPMQLDIMRKFEEYALSHATDDEHKEKLKSLIEEYTKQIYGLSATQFARKAFISAAVGSFSDETEKKEVNQIVQEMPNSKSKVHAFFIKYGNKISNSEDAAKSFVIQAIPTAEHIQPKSKGGENMLSNYIADCGYCNNTRLSLDFYEWVKEIPDFQEKLQEYLSEVQEAIDKGALDLEYQKYISAVIEKIENLSNGEIKLQLTKSKAPKIVAQTPAEKKRITKELGQIIEEMITRRDNLYVEISEIEDSEEYGLYTQYESLSHKINESTDKKNKLEEELQRLEKAQSKTSHIVIPFFRKTANKSDRDAFKTYSIKMRIKKRQEEKRKLCDDIKKLKTEKRAIAVKIPAISDLEAQISKLSVKQSEKNEIMSEIQKCRRVIGSKTGVLQSNIQASDKFSELKEQNKNILAKGFDVSDTADYDEYKRDIELLAQGERIKTERKRNGNWRGAMYEIFDIGIAALSEKIRVLSKKESVIYFENIEKMQKLYADMDEYSKKLAGIYEAEEQHDILYRRLLEISKEIGDIDIDSEIERLNQKKSLLEKIKQIKSMRAEYKKLSDTIAHNQQIHAQMQNYNLLSTVEFSRLYKSIIR
ncbi:MAG: hypothetical protein IKR34_02340 [Candidatus Gastranaerophilales bacterium]|nr:hypothetical protein [Candidatus Gastranaerophilales bacterium]